MHINDIENIMNYLFSAALKKCGNFEDAEDLTSETLLAALKYPKEIKDMKKWLSAVLNHKYYDMLRRKYKLPTVSINLVSEDMFPCEEENADVPSAEEIRREVAYLSGKYREVIVRHYLVANSIGAFFSMNAFAEKKISKTLFISPIVNMEKLITDMMIWSNVTEDELCRKKYLQILEKHYLGNTCAMFESTQSSGTFRLAFYMVQMII